MGRVVHVVWAAALAAAVMAAGCQKSGEEGATTQAAGQTMAQASPTAHTYVVRGVLRELPAAGDEDRQIFVQHEAIPDFVDMSGKKTGMASMTMPFTLGPGVSTDGLQPGDKVQMTFVVDWDKNTEHVTKLAKLPADTELKLKGMGAMSMPAATMPATGTAPAK